MHHNDVTYDSEIIRNNPWHKNLLTDAWENTFYYESIENGRNYVIVLRDPAEDCDPREYEMEDGMILVVAVEGVIAEIKEPMAEMPEAPEAEVEVEVEAQAETATPKRIVESVSKEMFFAEIEKLRTEIAELKSVKQELSSEVVVEPLTHSPEVKNEVKLNKISTNRQMTTQDIVMAKLFN